MAWRKWYSLFLVKYLSYYSVNQVITSVVSEYYCLCFTEYAVTYTSAIICSYRCPSVVPTRGPLPGLNMGCPHLLSLGPEKRPWRRTCKWLPSSIQAWRQCNYLAERNGSVHNTKRYNRSHCKGSRQGYSIQIQSVGYSRTKCLHHFTKCTWVWSHNNLGKR